jgi:hypothetical protein
VAKLLAEGADIDDVDAHFQKKRLTHLRARKRADLVVVESGPAKDPIAHVRFRRVAVSIWMLECATHTGAWQPTGVRGTLRELLDTVTSEFSWAVAKIV